jgi:hypothetical protein
MTCLRCRLAVAPPRLHNAITYATIDGRLGHSEIHPRFGKGSPNPGLSLLGRSRSGSCKTYCNNDRFFHGHVLRHWNRLDRDAHLHSTLLYHPGSTHPVQPLGCRPNADRLLVTHIVRDHCCRFLFDYIGKAIQTMERQTEGLIHRFQH